MKPHTSFSTLIGSLCIGLFTLGGNFAPTTQAAEVLTLKIGLLQQSIQLRDLEEFAQTGQISPNLKPYSFLLTPQVQALFQRRLHFDRQLGQQFLDELLATEEGERLLEQLKTALPKSNVEEIKIGLEEALQQADALSFISFLRVYPRQNLTLDLGATATMAAQMGTSNLQSSILSPLLARDLKVYAAPHIPRNIDPTLSGKETVYKETIIFRDYRRKRTIPADIYYGFNPQEPLVVMSHGFAADRNFLKYLAHHLASYGFTVVVVEHPGSNIHSLGQMQFGFKFKQFSLEFVERPQDIIFVLDELEKINKYRHYLSGKFNTDKVSIIGHSFGGYTALALAGAKLKPQNLRIFCQELTPLGRSPADWLQCAAAELPMTQVDFTEPRIKQAIALNPIVGHLFGDTVSDIKIPTLILASSQDGITPNIGHQLQPFQQLQTEKYLLVAVGATHMSVTDISYLNSAMGQSTLVREIMDTEANPVRNLAQAISLAFIKQLTPQAKEYKPFLTPAYVQSLSRGNISLRLTRTIPPSVESLLKVLSISGEKITLDRPKKQPLFLELYHYIAKIKPDLSVPQYETGKLEEILSGLLKTYQQRSKNLSSFNDKSPFSG